MVNVNARMVFRQMNYTFVAHICFRSLSGASLVGSELHTYLVIFMQRCPPVLVSLTQPRMFARLYFLMHALHKWHVVNVYGPQPVFSPSFSPVHLCMDLINFGRDRSSYIDLTQGSFSWPRRNCTTLMLESMRLSKRRDSEMNSMKNYFKVLGHVGQIPLSGLSSNIRTRGDPGIMCRGWKE